MTAYDYTNQAWVVDGKYVRCGHVTECACYGKLHEGEAVHLEAALALCKKMNWPTELLGGATKDGYCFVFKNQ